MPEPVGRVPRRPIPDEWLAVAAAARLTSRPALGLGTDVAFEPPGVW